MNGKMVTVEETNNRKEIKLNSKKALLCPKDTE